MQVTSTEPSDTSGPAVTGPRSVSRSAGPPTFQPNPRPNGFYAFEIASDPALFDAANSSRRTPQTHYGSWQDTPFMSSASYTLSQTVWTQLKGNAQLHYRLWTSASNSGW